MAGVPMLPPTSVGSPPAARISPASAVVVVLPLEPVMATIGPGKKSGGEFDFADDRLAVRRAWTSCGRIEGNARADDDQVLFLKGALAVAAGFDGDAVFEEQQNLVAQLASGLESETVTRAPCALRKSAEATPDLPRPTTRTLLSLRSMWAIS